jgi:retron-type reverse transcriptase
VISSDELECLERRNKAIDRRRGSNRDWLRRHAYVCSDAVHLGPVAVKAVSVRLIPRIADTRNLHIAWQHVSERSGDTAGPDGFTKNDFEPHEVRDDFLRQVGKAIAVGTYSCGKPKAYPVPKTSGGHRVIHLFNLEDRVVQRAIVQVLQPLLDCMFDDRSFGFRPHRSRFDALRDAGHLTSRGHTVWLVEDLKDAFGSVPLARVLQVLKRYVHDERIVDVARSALQPDGLGGLPQGGPLSPLLMNLYCDHEIDRPWRSAFAHRPLLRYVDNLLIPCVSSADAQQARTELTRRLRSAALCLRTSADPRETVRDLGGGDTAVWLGYEVALGDMDELVFTIPETVWPRLAERMLQAKAEGLKDANKSVIAWIKQQGPTYSSVRRDDVFARLERACETAGLALTVTREELSTRWRKAWRDWSRMRKEGPRRPA